MTTNTTGERYFSMTPEQENAFDAHEAWHKATYAEIINAGSTAIGAAPTTMRLFAYAFAKGLQEVGPEWIAKRLEAMPKIPTVFPGGATTHPYQSFPETLQQGRADFSSEHLPQLVADIRCQADHLRKLADEIERRGEV